MEKTKEHQEFNKGFFETCNLIDDGFDHLMIDLETLGTKKNAAICSIAVVQFDIVTGQTGQLFSRNVDMQSSLDAGLSVDGATIRWWLAKSESARMGVLHDFKSLHHVLGMVSGMISLNLDPGKVQVWGNGSGFDLSILTSAYHACNIWLPWDQYVERDVRTLVSLAPEIKKDMPFEGTVHDPMADCLHQIKYLSATYRKIMGVEYAGK